MLDDIREKGGFFVNGFDDSETKKSSMDNFLIIWVVLCQNDLKKSQFDLQNLTRLQNHQNQVKYVGKYI